MTEHLRGKKVAILVTDGFEQIELVKPKEALENAGAETAIVSPSKTKVVGWNHTEKADSFKVDLSLEEADPETFDALLLPGGLYNPDQLRQNEQAVRFVKTFHDSGKPIAAICHGPWLLINAMVVKGKNMTSYPSLKADLVNAGANWSDKEVVTDQGLVTSRDPKDLPAFNRKMIEEIAEGNHQRRSTQSEELRV